ncbi:MAG: HAD-IC family P-type ATPase [Brevundimonas sp.]|uniref:heavy metal translocating P-type ATPase n=1 Tax=Brevundimonas sp. TaxID=1871086 RepID=UPI0024885927|nr:HAD-IC family P-type ATPase [Brevundimonas sp.]MDI1328172.1 HAD-IC family P-type ATPase [Brevundimonas sp.]
MPATAVTRQLFAVDGLWCGGCARGLESRLRAINGVVSAGVHYVTASALVQWDPDRCDAEAVHDCVRQAGYRLLDRSDPLTIRQRLDREVRSLTLRLVVAVAFGMWSMACAAVLYLDPGLSSSVAWWIALASGVLAAPVIGFSGAGIGRMAVRSIRLRAPGLDLLIGLGVVGSVATSAVHLARGGAQVYFDTATMLVTLLVLARLIETRVRRNATDATLALGRPFDDTAERRDDGGGWELVAGDRLEIGDVVQVRAGGVSTVDGVVVSGQSAVDTAILTGESGPSALGVGDRIVAGAVNLVRPLEVRVDRLSGDRDVDRMGGRIALELAARGEPIDSVSRAAGALTTAIPIVSLLVVLVSTIMTRSIETGLVRGLVVMLAACPCALALAAPLVHLRSGVIAAGGGFRLADAGVIERLTGPRTAIFDKTGTLTAGQPRVLSVEVRAGWTEAEVVALAARAETGLDHPLARAITARNGGPLGAGGSRGSRDAQALDPAGRRIRVGGAQGGAAEGLTRLRVWLDDTPVGDLLIGDAIDPEAGETILELRRRGIDVLLATGDAEGPAHAVARAVGLEPSSVFAGCTPLSKAELVRRSRGPVLFVGDGVNDGPALAAADCGISVSRAHTAASATAAVVITRGGLGRVSDALNLAVAARRRLRQNIVLALAYNVFALPAAALGLLSPAWAAVAMIASSLAVTANALRLKIAD